MKLKKKPKKILITLLVIITIVVVGVIVHNNASEKTPTVKAVKVINTIDEYGYNLKENKSKKYKQLFKELEEILSEEKVDEEKYASKIGEMFIYDFYSLSDKTAKTDVGGIDFIYPSILENFLQNAENTYYKYVESNIYNNREQKLPTVSEVTIDSIEKIEYAYGEQVDSNAYKVKISWTYTDADYSDYQQNATLIFIHDGKKLCLVELK